MNRLVAWVVDRLRAWVYETKREKVSGVNEPVSATEQVIVVLRGPKGKEIING